MQEQPNTTSTPPQDIAGKAYQFLQKRKVKNFPSSEQEFRDRFAQEEAIQQSVYSYMKDYHDNVAPIKNFPADQGEFVSKMLGDGSTEADKKKASTQPEGVEYYELPDQEVAQVDSGQDATAGSTPPSEAEKTETGSRESGVNSPVSGLRSPDSGKRLGVWDSVVNSVSNAYQDFQSIPDRLGLLEDNFIQKAEAQLGKDSPVIKAYNGMVGALNSASGAEELSQDSRERIKKNLADLDAAAARMKPTQDLSDEWDQAREDGDYSGVVGAVLSSVPSLVSSVAQAAVSGGSLPIVDGIAREYHDTLSEQAKDSGESPLSILDANTDKEVIPMLSGALQGALEKFPAERIAGQVGRGFARQGWVPEIVKKAPLGFWTRAAEVAKTGGIEGTTEFLQAVISDVGKDVALEKDIDVAWDDAIEQGILGAIGGGLIGGVQQSAEAAVSKKTENEVDDETESEESADQSVEPGDGEGQDEGGSENDLSAVEEAGSELNQNNVEDGEPGDQELTQEELSEEALPADSVRDSVQQPEVSGQEEVQRPNATAPNAKIKQGDTEYEVFLPTQEELKGDANTPSRPFRARVINRSENKEVSEGEYEAVMERYKNEFDYTVGQEADLNVRTTDEAGHIVKYSQNPAQLAVAWILLRNQAKEASKQTDTEASSQTDPSDQGEPGVVKFRNRRVADSEVTYAKDVTEEENRANSWESRTGVTNEAWAGNRFRWLTGLELDEDVAQRAMDQALAKKNIDPEPYVKQDYGTQQEAEQAYYEQLKRDAEEGGATAGQSASGTRDAQSASGRPTRDGQNQGTGRSDQTVSSNDTRNVDEATQRESQRSGQSETDGSVRSQAPNSPVAGSVNQGSSSTSNNEVNESASVSQDTGQASPRSGRGRVGSQSAREETQNETSASNTRSGSTSSDTPAGAGSARNRDRQPSERPTGNSGADQGASGPESSGSSDADPRKPRRLAKYQLESPNISAEIKRVILSDDQWRTYQPKENKHSVEEARALIERQGLDLAVENLVAQMESGRVGATEAMMGEILMQRLSEEADRATHETTRQSLQKRAEDLGKIMAERMTEAGQFAQARAMFAYLTPDGQIRAIENIIKKDRKGKLKGVEGEMKSLIEDLDSLVEQVVGDVMKGKSYRRKIDRLLEEFNKKQQPKKRKAKNKADQVIDWLEKQKQAAKKDPNAAYSVTHALGLELYQAALNVVQEALRAGKNLVEAIDQAIAYIKKKHKGEWDEAGFRASFKDQLNAQKEFDLNNNIPAFIRLSLTEQGQRIDELVRYHYQHGKGTVQGLVDEFTKELGVPQTEAQRLAKAVQAEYEKIATDRKAKLLKKLYNKRSSPKKRQMFERIVEAHNLGVLNDAKVSEEYSDYYEVPRLSEQDRTNLKEAAERVHKAQKGRPKDEAIQDLYKVHEKILFKHKHFAAQAASIAGSIWYAHILSGPTTHLKNLYANAIQLVLGGITTTMQLASRGQFNRIAFVWRGLARGANQGRLKAGRVLSKGYAPMKGESKKTEGPRIMEWKRFPGILGLLPNGYFGLLKYVSRSLQAGDILFYHMNREMRARQYAAAMASKQNTMAKVAGKKTKNTVKLAREILYGPARDSAIQQALDENYTKGSRAYHARVFELTEAAWNPELKEDADYFAAKQTFNHPPEGMLGVLARLISTAHRFFGITRGIVPFTETVVNATNAAMNYIPAVALYRAGRGSRLTATGREKFSAEERERIAWQGVQGSLLMGTLFALTQAGDDDEEPWIEITANGYGDYRKNYELQGRGWQATTIKVGDKRYNYLYSSLAPVFAFVGAWRDAEKYGGVEAAPEKLALSTMVMATYMMQSSALTGATDFFKLFEGNPTKKYFYKRMGNYLAKFPESTVPVTGSNFYRQMMRTYQDIVNMDMKMARTLGTKMKRDIPGWREDLPSIYDNFGRKVEVEMVDRWMPLEGDFLNTGSILNEMEPFELPLDKHNLTVNAPQRIEMYDAKTGDVRDMTDAEYSEYHRQSGEMIRIYLEENVEKLMNKDRDGAKKLLAKKVKQYRAKVRKQIAGIDVPDDDNMIDAATDVVVDAVVGVGKEREE